MVLVQCPAEKAVFLSLIINFNSVWKLKVANMQNHAVEQYVSMCKPFWYESYDSICRTRLGLGILTFSCRMRNQSRLAKDSANWNKLYLQRNPFKKLHKRTHTHSTVPLAYQNQTFSGLMNWFADATCKNGQNWGDTVSTYGSQKCQLEPGNHAGTESLFWESLGSQLPAGRGVFSVQLSL